MTENKKKFLEFVSSLDKETKKKVSLLEKDGLMAFAAEKGFTLTDADFEQADSEGEISLDEVDAVAGGGCRCVAGGDGRSDNDNDKFCGCVLYGEGNSDECGHNGSHRCACAWSGNGHDT